MKKTVRIAAIAAALCAVVAMTAGCRNEKQIAEGVAAAIAGSEQLLALEAGEIMLYQSVKLDQDVEGHAVNSVTESYVKYARADGELDYDLGATVTRVVGGEITSYDARYENGQFEQFLNSEPMSTDEIPEPDLFLYFRIDFAKEDVASMEVVGDGSSVTLYAMTMNEAYFNQFDSESDGVKYDCTKLVYNYYLDASGVLRQVLSEQTATLTLADGSTQEVVIFTQVKSE